MINGVRQFKLINALGREYDMTRPDALLHAPDGLGWGTERTVNRLGMTYIGINEKEIHQSPSGEMVFRTYEEYGRFLSFCQQGGLVLCYKPIDTWYYCEALISIQKSEIQWENNHLICPVQFTLLSYWYEKVVAQTAEPPEPVEPNYATVTGDPAVFTARYSYPIKDLSVAIQGSQELNGYSKPWVGRAGKNLANPENKNTARFTVDDNGVFTQNTPTSASWAWTYSQSLITVTLGAGTYYVSFFAETLSTSISAQMQVFSSANTLLATTQTRQNSETGGFSITLTEQTTVGIVAKMYDGAWKFQIEKGTTATAYEPYENVCPITSYDSVTITQQSKNLFNGTLYNGQVGSDGAWSSSTTRLSNVSSATDYTLPIKVGTYTLSAQGSGLAKCNAMVKSSDGIIIDNYANSWQNLPLTFTVSQDGYLFFTLRANNTQQVLDPTAYTTVQVESGSTVTSYEPYQHTEKTVELTGGSNVYKGTLNVSTGELVVSEAVITLNTASMNNTTQSYPGWRTSGIKALIGRDKNGNSGSPSSITNNYGVNTTSTNDILFFFPNQINNISQTQFVGMAIDIDFLVPLATPQTYQLTPTQMSNLIGSNTIQADAGAVTVTYRTDARTEYKIYPYQYSYRYGDTAQNVFDISCDLPSYFKLTIFGEATNPTYRVVVNGNIVNIGRVRATIGSAQKMVVNTNPKEAEIALYTRNGTRINNLYGYSDFETERIFALPQGECQLQVITEDETQPKVMIEVLRHV